MLKLRVGLVGCNLRSGKTVRVFDWKLLPFVVPRLAVITAFVTVVTAEVVYEKPALRLCGGMATLGAII
jgi:hypothetical protein